MSLDELRSPGGSRVTLPFCYRWRPHPSRKELTCRQTPGGKVWRQDGEVMAVKLDNTASSADPAEEVPFSDWRTRDRRHTPSAKAIEVAKQGRLFA